MYELGEYLPDLDTVDLPGLRDVENFYPSATGWSSFPIPESVSRDVSLGVSVRGAASGRLQDGTTYRVAGTDTALWVSLLGQDFVQDAGSFTVPINSRWCFDQIGTYLLATNGNDAPQYRDLAVPASSFADVSADASLGKCAAIGEGFYILGDLTGRGANAAIGRLEAGVHWSAAGNPLSWPVVGTQAARDALSDFQPLEGDGGPVMAIVATEEYIAVFRERQTWRMDYVGLPDIFRFRLIDANRGCIVRDGAVAVGNSVYFPSGAGFHRFDGASVVPIGHQKVDKTWLSVLLRSALDRVSVAHVASLRSILWSTPTESSALFSSIFGFQYDMGRWFRLSHTGEWLTTVIPSAGGTLDSSPLDDYDMDSAVAPNLGDVVLDTLGQDAAQPETLAIYRTDHKLYLFTDSFQVNADQYLETGDFRSQDNRRTRLSGIRPHIGSIVPGFLGLVGIGVQVHARNRAQDAVAFDGSLKTRNMTAVGMIPYRTSGRYLRARFFSNTRVDGFQGFDGEFGIGGAR